MSAVLLASLALLLAVAARSRRTSGQVRRRFGAGAGRPSPLPGAPPWFAGIVASAMPGADARRWWLGWLAAAAAAACLALTGSLGGALVMATALIVAPVVAGSAGRRRDQRELEAALPDALDAVARSLRTGASLPGALAEAATSPAAGPVAVEWAGAAAAATAGVPVRDALAALVERRPIVPVRLAVAALSLAADAGGAPSQAVEQVAATLRDRAALAREVRALASQARASALVIAVAPVGFTALAGMADSKVLGFLLGSATGGACLALGLALDAAAAWWMARITRAAW